MMDDSSGWSSGDDETEAVPAFESTDADCSTKYNYICKVYKPKEILDYMDEIVQSVYEIIGLNHSVARLLLQHYKWDKEKLLERFFESDRSKILFDAHITNIQDPQFDQYDDNQDDLSDYEDAQSGSVQCGICFINFECQEMLCLHCRHRFCLSCWKGYLDSQILSDGRSDAIECPETTCKVRVYRSLISRLVTDPKVLECYHKLIANSFVEISKLFRWCPNPRCSNAIGVLYSAPLPVKCSCGLISCFQCGKNWHEPIQCQLLSMWLTKCDDDSESSNWLAANTKDCPGCNFPIEKRGGCNHMTCSNSNCRFEFCWICLGPWKPHGVEWYQCNRYNEDASREAHNAMEKSRAALHRYLHYYNRYINHMNSLKLENKLQNTVRVKMHYLQSTGMSWIEVQFLKTAVDVLLQCRQTLMHTYAFAYYLAKNNQSLVFEQNQADLERATENLSYFLEGEITFIEADKLKQWIQDKYRYCKSRRDVLVNHVREGYDRDYWEYRVVVPK